MRLNQRLLLKPPIKLKKKSANFVCQAQLTDQIEAIINRSEFSTGRWGILIQTLSSTQTLYSRDANKYFIPASNIKLLTTAAALEQLKEQFRIRTSIYGTNDGYLRVVGRGDPSLTNTQLTELTHQLKRGGIRQVKVIIAEDNYFQGYFVNPSWEWEDLQADYGAPINSLILNQNAVQLTLLPQQLGQPLQIIWNKPVTATQWQIKNKAITVNSSEPSFINLNRNLADSIIEITGQLAVNSEPESVSLAVIDPKKNFLTHLNLALVTEGINLTIEHNNYQGAELIRRRLRLAVAPELAAIESPPLSELLIETNQNSNNLYAEALLRILGVLKGDTSQNSAEMGITVVKNTLTKLGVDPASYVLVDGAGLSRHNLVTPAVIVQTLKAMAASSVYRTSLPVAGMSGTLKNRFQDSAARGIVQAKTGTMSGVVALSGYVDVPEYETLIFSIMVNQTDLPASTVRAAIDEVVLLLTGLHYC